MEKEMVNHPDHYQGNGLECIDVMLAVFGKEATQNFCLLNAFKYLYRCNKKGKKNEDINKAIWYLNKYNDIENFKNVEEIILFNDDSPEIKNKYQELMKMATPTPEQLKMMIMGL